MGYGYKVGSIERHVYLDDVEKQLEQSVQVALKI